ncbi:MAG: flavin reductase [Chloroflexi bacterium]|nr:flavin reductase [Chloroflexota bacterium]
MDLRALFKVSYGMYIVGSRGEDKANAQIANTVFQVTSEPPTVAICINRKNLTHELVAKAGVFTVSVLCQDTPLSFIGGLGFKSGRDVNKLEGIEHRTGKTGAPIVTENAISCMEAKVVKQMDVGTHTIFVGQVVEADVLNEKPSMTYEYYHQVKRGTTPKTAPTYVSVVKKEQTA